MRLAFIVLSAPLLTACLGGRDLAGCSAADRGDPTSRCYCLDAADRDRIRPYDDNAPPAYEADVASPPSRESLYDGSTVQPVGGGAVRGGPAVLQR